MARPSPSRPKLCAANQERAKAIIAELRSLRSREAELQDELYRMLYPQ
jgi:hypothetical protein